MMQRQCSDGTMVSFCVIAAYESTTAVLNFIMELLNRYCEP